MNKTYICAAISAIIGVAAGAGAGWYVAHKNYEIRLAKEVDSVRATYARCIRERNAEKKYSVNVYNSTGTVDEPTDVSNNEVDEFKDKDYTSYFDPSKTETPDISKDDDSISSGYYPDGSSEPRVIDEDEYYDEYDNDAISNVEIYLFDKDFSIDSKDPFMTDDRYEPIEDPESIISKKDLLLFIESDKDEIFTRSDSRNCIYCIEKQGETWAETLKRHPIILETNY